MDVSRVLVASGLTLWLAGLAAAAAYIGRRMRFPTSRYARYSGGSSGWFAAIAGLLVFAWSAYSIPTVAFVFTLFATGFVPYVTGAYVIALNGERRRAARLGAPEPGTQGTISFAEFAAFLAVAVMFAVTASALTVYGIANEIGGNHGEGLAGLGLGAFAWLLAFVMGLFASPLVLAGSRR